jgi:hypothetical protein
MNFTWNHMKFFTLKILLYRNRWYYVRRHSAKKLLSTAIGLYGDDRSKQLLSPGIVDLCTTDRLRQEVRTHYPFKVERMGKEVDKSWYIINVMEHSHWEFLHNLKVNYCVHNIPFSAR